MEKKEMITPKQAYEAAKVLWPNTSHVKKLASVGFIHIDNTDHIPASISTIDWGNETRYPPPEPEWVDAVFPDDVGKEGRLSNNKDAWTYEKIRGRNMYGDWICDSGLRRNCQVRKVKT
jgi:hypothetical protein